MTEVEKRGSTSLALKAGFWYVLSTFLVKGLSFITTPIFSRLMSKEDYGEFSNFASWMATLLIITGAELYNTVGRAYYDFRDDYDKYVSTVTVASCGMTCMMYILALLGGEAVTNFLGIPEQYIHILFFILMFQSCKQIFMAKERTLYRYKAVAVISVFNLLIPTIIAVVMVLLAEENQRLSARIYGFYVPSALIGMGCAVVLLIKGKGFDFKYCKYAFSLSLPLLVHYLSAHLLTSSNTIVTKQVLGAEAVSQVSIASSANHILTILLQSISGAMTTWLMDNLEQKNSKATRKGILVYVFGIFVLAFGVMLFAPEVIWLLGGAKYADSVILMPGMVVAVLIQSVTTIFTIILTYQKAVTKTALYTTCISVICVIAKALLLPICGVNILPYINIFCFGVLFFINYYLVKKAGCAEYVNLKGILCIILVAFISMLSCYYLYNHNVIRYSLIGILVIAVLFVMYRYREKIISIIRRKLRKK